MSIYGVIQAARHFINGPLVRPAKLRWEEKAFLSPQSTAAHFGVYESFAQARRHLPESPGFNLDALAYEYVNVRTKRVFEYDYPVMRWMEQAFRAGAVRVLDIGGSVGVHYFAYSRYLDMPARLVWDVVELPEIASVGRNLAAEFRATALSFTTDLDAAIGGRHDIWTSAGAIQYFEDAHPAGLLRRCRARPVHLLLNKLPLYEGEDFVTSQNLGEGSFSPLHVYNRRRFIQSIKELGYSLRDTWDVHDRSMYIPGYPEHSFPTFSGLYFVKA